MRTPSTGSDCRSHRGALPYLNAHFKLRGVSRHRSFAQSITAVKMIWFFAFSGGAEHLSCSLHLEEHQFVTTIHLSSKQTSPGQPK